MAPAREAGSPSSAFADVTRGEPGDLIPCRRLVIIIILILFVPAFSKIFMDRTSVIVLVLCMLAFFGWFILMNKLYPPKPMAQLPVQSNAVASTSQVANETNAVPATLTASTPAATPSVQLPVANTNVAEKFL